MESGEFRKSSVSTLKTTYTVSYEIIRQFINTNFENPRLKSQFKQLKQIGIIDEGRLLNAHRTILGFVMMKYFEYHFEIDSSFVDEPIMTKTLDTHYFSKLFSKITELIRDKQFILKYFYFIYGLNTKNSELANFYHKNSKLVVTNPKDAETLSKSLYISTSDDTLSYDKFAWITNSSAWISGELILDLPNLNINNRASFFFDHPQVIHPQYLEEAFWLLGHFKVQIKFLNPPIRSNYHDVRLTPTSNGLTISYPNSFPSWFYRLRPDYYFFNEEKEFENNEVDSLILSNYPRFRQRANSDNFTTMILNRARRCFTNQVPTDSILEAIIIAESLVVKETRELTYQLKLKLSWLIALNHEDRELFAEMIQKLYSIRSDIVHNGGLNIVKKSSYFGGFIKASSFAKIIVRLVILRILVIEKGKMNMVDRGKLTKFLEKTMIRGEFQLEVTDFYKIIYKEIRTQILDILPN